MRYTTFMTPVGCDLLERSQLEGVEIHFTHFELGSGCTTAPDIQHLLEPKHLSGVNELHHDGEKLEIATYVPSVEISVPFAFREIGLYATIGSEDPVLYIYSAKPDADMLGGDEVISHTFQFDLHISQGSSITVTLSDDVQWATKKEVRGHLRDLNNPHQVNKTQVGLGMVENYAYLELGEVESQVGLLKHVTHLTVKALVDLYVGNHSKLVNPHQVKKGDLGLGLVENLSTTELGDIVNPKVDGWVKSYLTPEMMYNLLKNLVNLGDLTLQEFQEGADLLFKSKLVAGTPNLEITQNELGQTEVRWVGSTIPNSVAWTDVGIAEDSPGRNRQLVKYLAPYLLSSDLMAGTGVKLTPVEYSDPQGNTKTKLRVECILPDGIVMRNQFVSSEDVQVQLDNGRISFDVGALKGLREELAKKLEMTIEELQTFVSGSVPIKTVRSINVQTATVQVVGGELQIDVKPQSGGGGGTGPAPDLTPYLKKTEAEATYAKLGHTHPGGGSVDLSGYYTKQEIDNEVSGYAKKSELRLVESGHVQDLLKINEIQGQHTEQIEALGKSVREGKASVAAAITSKGVPTSEDATFMTMANSILNIPSGGGFVPPEYTTVAFWKDWTTISDSSYRIATSGGSSDFVIWKMIGPGNFILVPWKLPYCATNITVRYAYSTVIYTSKEGGESVNKTLDTATGDEKTFDYRLIPRCLSEDGKWVYGTSVTQSSILMKAPVGDLNDTRILTTGGVVMSSLKWVVGNDSTFVTQGGVYHINSTLSMVSYSGSLPTSGYAVVGSNILVHTSFYDYGVGGGNRYKVCKVVLDGSTATLVDFKTCIENGTPGKLYYGFHRGFSIIGDAIYNTDLLKVRDLVPIANYIPRGDYLVYGTSFVSKDTTRSINVSPLNNPVTCGYQGVKYIASNLNTSTKIVYITSVNATADQLDTLECEEDAVFTPNGMHVITKLKGGVRGVYTYPGKKFLRACNHAGTYKTLLSNDLTYIGTFQSTIQQWDGKKYVDLVHGESTSNNNLTAIDREFRYATSYDGWIYTLPECTRLGRPNGKPNAVIGDYLYCTEMSGNSVVGTWVYRITGSSLVLISTSTGIPTHRGEVLGTATYTRLGNSNQLYNLEDKTFHQLTDIHSDFKLSDSYATGYDGGIFCTSGYVLSLLEASKREALLRL